MRICAECRHYRRWWASLTLKPHDDCLATATRSINPITGYAEENGIVGCYTRNEKGDCSLFERRGLIAWIMRYLGRLRESDARDGDGG